jgi:primosomal protein N'
MEPSNGLFAGLVFLDGETQLNYPSLRAEERLLNQWFSLVARGHEGAPLYLSLPSQHRIVQLFNSRGSARISNAILEERRNAKLPPWYRFMRLSGTNLVSLQQKIKEEFPSIEVSRMVNSTEILIRVPVEQSQEVVDAISALAKYRAAKALDLISMRIDPYEI